MGADHEGGVRRRPVRAVVYAACGVVLLAGCASMPDSGDLRDVESTPRQDTQVRVFAMPPAEGAQPWEIVQGFLEALTSDDPHYDTARKYLTPDAARHWRPEQSATVLADGPDIEPDGRPGGRANTGSRSYTLAGDSVATLDEHQAYAPADSPYSKKVRLALDAKTKQWRISGLPQGVVMGQSDFQRNYKSVNKYYFASNTSIGATGQPVAVADPVFVREGVDPMTQVVRSLISGPTTWLSSVVRSSFPTGAALRKGTASLTPDDQNKLTVPLNGKASHVGTVRCAEMATQLLFTLRDMAPVVDTVELRGADGRRLCDLGEGQAEHTTWDAAAKSPEYLYFLDDKHRVVRMAGHSGGTSAAPVPGALGEAGKELRSVAVSRDERTAAGVGIDGKSLYVASLSPGSPLGDPLVTSQGATEHDRLTTPSWDARGDLWVADRDPHRPRLLLLEQGRGEPVSVQTPELPGRIKDVRVAADGVRMALVVEKGDKQSLLVGRIERDERSAGHSVSVTELRSVTPELEQVTAISWAGDSRLVVAGQEHGGVLQMRYVQIDGSTPDGPAPAALSGVRAITASEDDQLPLVAYSEDGIVRLPSGAQWQKVVKEGSAPVYPG
ncbi:LpqB family beta-propeller domain-containing protein [Streptomyces sp. NPDC001544]|uniref:LpqB family beta-propeller domain-containing protein n=1 Tax=Streptomyces sp. NPDC001544 TaxID=3364584 RepID=UPI003679B5DB